VLVDRDITLTSTRKQMLHKAKIKKNITKRSYNIPVNFADVPPFQPSI